MKKNQLLVSGLTVASFLLTGVAAKAEHTADHKAAAAAKDAEAKCAEGKCGKDMKKDADAKCGKDKMEGEAKCGAKDVKKGAKDADAKCGEGTCGKK